MQTDSQTNALKTIADRAMIAQLTVSMWSARKTDRKVTGEVATAHNVAVSTGNYNKSLLPNCNAYEAVKTAGGDLGATLRAMSLPWMKNGSRILLAAGYVEFARVMKAKKEAYDIAVDKFLAEYPQHVEKARQDLNGLFNPADYPDAADLRDKFKAELLILNVPTEDDFRVQLSADAISTIREGITDSVKAALVEASTDAWQRIREALAAMSERLNDGTAVYRDSLFGNLQEIVTLLPALNVMEDPKLTELGEKIAAEVLKFKPQECRDDKSKRAATAAQVDALLASIPADYAA